MRRCVHCAMGEKWERQLTYHFLPLITGTENIMLLIFFLGLIVKLAAVCDGCDVGTSEVNNFDWNQLGIIVLTRIMKQSAFKTAA